MTVGFVSTAGVNIQEYLHLDSEHMMLLRFLRSSSLPASEQPAGNSASPLNGYVGLVIAHTPGSWTPLLRQYMVTLLGNPPAASAPLVTSEKSPARRWGRVLSLSQCLLPRGCLRSNRERKRR